MINCLIAVNLVCTYTVNRLNPCAVSLMYINIVVRKPVIFLRQISRIFCSSIFRPRWTCTKLQKIRGDVSGLDNFDSGRSTGLLPWCRVYKMYKKCFKKMYTMTCSFRAKKNNIIILCAGNDPGHFKR